MSTDNDITAINLSCAKIVEEWKPTPELVIGCIRNAAPFMDMVFLHGSCWRFYLILKSVWAEAEPWSNGQHIITRIGKSFYDITGKVKREAGYRRVTPAMVLKDRPHLWVCDLERLANIMRLDPEALVWELDSGVPVCNRNKEVALCGECGILHKPKQKEQST